MKVGPFTPPDVRDAILSRKHNSHISQVMLPDFYIHLAHFSVCIFAHEGIPLNFAEERFLSTFIQTPQTPLDFQIQARCLSEMPQLPDHQRPEECSIINDTYWRLYGYRSVVEWKPGEPLVYLNYSGTLLDAVESLRMFIALQLVYRHIGILLHAASAIYNHHTYVFLGSSGAGKSTSVAYTPGKLLSDEMSAVLLDSQGISVQSTPFDGEHFPVDDVGRNPVFFFVEKAEKNLRKSLSPRNALTRFLSQTMMLPHAPMAFWHATIDMLGRVIDECPVEILYAAPGGTFWKELL